MKAYLYRCTLLEVEIEDTKQEEGQRVKCKLKTTNGKYIEIYEPEQNIYTNNKILINEICDDISYLSMKINRIGL